ncbi:MAG: DUF3179 domain-containing protein [Gemmatimonadetes bacterium]|nr:DUF3179 domain-containing protein [Gemmatimonadota bacterium]NNM06782.1 DUF3179 domain-containing protein [Gemmatimonadota bacterium]
MLTASQSIILFPVLAAGLAGFACTNSPLATGGPGNGSGNSPIDTGGLCLIEGEPPRSGGVVKDGIPALSNPTMVSPDDPLASYVEDGDRIIGLYYADEWIALPLAILRSHEIVNLDGGSLRLAVTYCPLTGTGMGFDRHRIGENEFGVSGLLWRSNLVMYDRSTGESLWPQMRGRADCGPATGTILTPYPVSDMTWRAWKELHPDTKVISENTGWPRNYRENNYADYERIDAPPISTIIPDLRRQPKERVLGIPHPGGGTAIPFNVLPANSKAVLRLTIPGGDIAPGGVEVVVLWDGEKQAGEVFYDSPIWSVEVGGPDPEFYVENDRFVDSATGSLWEVDGRAVEGPASGSRLTEVIGSMTAFWFAWAAFNPDTELFLNTI